MKLLLDQHFSRKLVSHICAIFPETNHVVGIGLTGSPDHKVWEYARDQGSAILTKDKDFQNLSFSRGHPPKIVLLRSGNGSNAQVLQAISRARSIIEQFSLDETQSLLLLL